MPFVKVKGRPLPECCRVLPVRLSVEQHAAGVVSDDDAVSRPSAARIVGFVAYGSGDHLIRIHAEP